MTSGPALLFSNIVLRIYGANLSGVPAPWVVVEFSGGNAVITASPGYEVGQTYLCQLIYTGRTDNHLQLWVNGNLIQSVVTSGSLLSSAYDMTLGAETGGPGLCDHAYFSDVAFYPYALTYTQIAERLSNALFAECTQVRQTNFPGTYKLTNPGSPSAMLILAFSNSQPVDYPKPLGDILDHPSLELARMACRANGLWGSLCMDSQRKAADWLEELYYCMIAAPVWAGFKLKSIPYSEMSAVGNGAVYNAPTASGPIADLDESDFIGSGNDPLVTVKRKAQVDVPNILQMQHPLRSNDYNDVVTAQPEQGEPCHLRSPEGCAEAVRDDSRRLDCAAHPGGLGAPAELPPEWV